VTAPAAGREPEARQALREWTFERVGQLCMAAFLAAALLGAFGGGLLASAVVRGDGDVQVRYERLTRTGRPEDLIVEVPASAASRDRIVVRLSTTFLDRLQRLEVSPSPLAVRGEGGERRFAFAASREPARLRFHFEHERPGIARGWLAVADGRPMALTQVVYP
jgi:hypothetical protein